VSADGPLHHLADRRGDGVHDRDRRGHAQEGDRQLNCALHRIAVTRARIDPATRDYLRRKQAEGKTRTEALRCLKRHLARRIWKLLQAPPEGPSDRASFRIEAPISVPMLDIGATFEGDDFGVVDEPVDHRDGGDLITEALAPGAEGLVAGDDQRGALVARGDETEHQVGGLGSNGMSPTSSTTSSGMNDSLRSSASRVLWRLASARWATHSVAVANATRWPARQARIETAIARCVLPVPGGHGTNYSRCGCLARACALG
jgi:hypothetical protein